MMIDTFNMQQQLHEEWQKIHKECQKLAIL